MLLGASVAGSYAQQLAAVKQGGKWGYIDTKGAWAITAQFDEAKPFSGGYAAVRVGEKWGYINQKGVIVIAPQFDRALPFSDTEEGMAFGKASHTTTTTSKQQSTASVSIQNNSETKLTGEGVFDVDGLDGTLSFDKEMGKYIIRQSPQGTYDDVNIYILNEKNANIKLGEGRTMNVVVSGQAQVSTYHPKAQVGGVKYYDLRIQSISISQSTSNR